MYIYKFICMTIHIYKTLYVRQYIHIRIYTYICLCIVLIQFYLQVITIMAFWQTGTPTDCYVRLNVAGIQECKECSCYQ